MTSFLKLAFCKRVAQGQDISSITAASPYQLRETKREAKDERIGVLLLKVDDLQDKNLYNTFYKISSQLQG